MIKEQMEAIYRSVPLENIPWNMAKPPKLLTDWIENNIAKPGKIIDLGCGTGNTVRHLAKLGFESTGVDISEAAIEIAKSSAKEEGVKCNFIAADVLDLKRELSECFDCVYDWEVMHHVFPENRNKYVQNVAKILNPGGWYLSVCFSEDSPQFGGKGKYRKTPLNTELYFSSEIEMKRLFEKELEVSELNTIDVQGKWGMHRAIIAIMTKGA